MKPLLLLTFCLTLMRSVIAAGGVQFVGFTNFTQFPRVQTEGRTELLSPTIKPEIPWDELIVSWNYRERNSGLIADVKVTYPEHETSWYCMGRWSWDGSKFPRKSVRGQKDAGGKVDTDTLRMQIRGGEVQVRITLVGESADPQKLAFLGLCFSDSRVPQERDQPSGKSIGPLNVPEHSQADYIEGINSWCSPTATAMILEYWANKLNRPNLKHDVPEVARGVEDPIWPGTGNWPFNTAFAGAHEGIRAYVRRLRSVAELQKWLEAGIPVACSVSYNLLKGKTEKGNGHLVVCIGFDEKGDVIVNDPGRKAVRQVYALQNFIRAWAESRNTVYLIYPEDFVVSSRSAP
jgi:hypothetical protein